MLLSLCCEKPTFPSIIVWVPRHHCNMNKLLASHKQGEREFLEQKKASKCIKVVEFIKIMGICLENNIV